MRLGRDGVIAPEAARLIEANSRTPEVVLGDLRAQIAAATRAARAVQSIADEIGADAFIQTTRACLDRGESQVRALIESLPAGPHRGADALDPSPGLPDAMTLTS